jgi:hypothetical protein
MRVIQTLWVFGVCLHCQIEELVLVADVFQQNEIIGDQLNDSAMLALVKQILCYKNHTQVAVMTAFVKYIAHLPGICLVQEVVENYETW